MVGVDKEELLPPKKPDKPTTPKGKIQNFWYHYKWVTIGGGCVLLLLVFLIHSMVTKTKYDYEILFVTNSFVDDASKKALEAELEKYAEDLDGNGEINVALDVIQMNMTDLQMNMANQQKFIATLQIKEKCLYILDEENYNNLYDMTKPKDESGEIDPEAEGEPLFAPIELQNDNIDTKHNYWNWKGSELQKLETLKGLPENLYFGVRNFEKKGEPTKERIIALELLRNIITDTKTEQSTDPSTTATAQNIKGE